MILNRKTSGRIHRNVSVTIVIDRCLRVQNNPLDTCSEISPNYRNSYNIFRFRSLLNDGSRCKWAGLANRSVSVNRTKQLATGMRFDITRIVLHLFQNIQLRLRLLQQRRRLERHLVAEKRLIAGLQLRRAS